MLNIILYMQNVIIVVLGITVIIIGVYVVMMFRKGKVNIVLPRTKFIAGEQIFGSIEIKVKQEIDCHQLKVFLIGWKLEPYRFSRNEHEKKLVEVFRNETILHESRHYFAGEIQYYEFKIDTPNIQSLGFQDTPLGLAVKEKEAGLLGRHEFMLWGVRAHLENKGVDVIGNQEISIDLGNK